MISVSVAYAEKHEQVAIPLQVELGCNVAIAIRRSQLLERFPHLDMGSLTVGIYGHKVPLDRALQPGDRIEIYRPLSIDPKEARRLRAARANK